MRCLLAGSDFECSGKITRTVAILDAMLTAFL